MTAMTPSPEQLVEPWVQAFACVDDFLLVVNRDYIIEYINKTLPHISIEEVLGTSALDYVLPEDEQKLREAYDRAYVTGEKQELSVHAEGAYETTTEYFLHICPLKIGEEVQKVAVIARSAD